MGSMLIMSHVETKKGSYFIQEQGSILQRETLKKHLRVIKALWVSLISQVEMLEWKDRR